MPAFSMLSKEGNLHELSSTYPIMVYKYFQVGLAPFVSTPISYFSLH